MKLSHDRQLCAWPTGSAQTHGFDVLTSGQMIAQCED